MSKKDRKSKQASAEQTEGVEHREPVAMASPEVKEAFGIPEQVSMTPEEEEALLRVELEKIQAKKAELVAAAAAEQARTRAMLEDKAAPLVLERERLVAEVESASERIAAITDDLVAMGYEKAKASKAEKRGFTLAVATVKQIAKKAGKVLPVSGLDQVAWANAGGTLENALPGAWLADVLVGLADQARAEQVSGTAADGAATPSA